MKILTLSALLMFPASILFSMDMAKPAETSQSERVQNPVFCFLNCRLSCACSSQSPELAATALADGADINRRYSNGYTPLVLAINNFYRAPDKIKESEELLRLLLGTPGLNISLCDAELWRPIEDKYDRKRTSLLQDRNAHILKILLEYKDRLTPPLDLNAQRGCSRTSALHYACAWENIEFVRLLCEQPEVNPNVKDPNGHTPLRWVMAHRFGKNTLPIIRLLANKGASFECKDNDGNTAADTAVRCPEYEKLVVALRTHIEPESVEEQMRRLSFILVPEKPMLDSIAYAWAHNGPKAAEAALGGVSSHDFFAKQPNLNLKDYALSLTPFMWAAARGRIDLAQALYAFKKVDVNAQDDFGDTALHHAARNGQAKMVAYLLSLPETNILIKNSTGLKAPAVAQNCKKWAPEPCGHDEVLKTFDKLYLIRMVFANAWERNFLTLDIAELIVKRIRL